LFTGGDGTVRLYRLDDGTELACAQLSEPIDPPSPEQLKKIIGGQVSRIPVNAPAVVSGTFLFLIIIRAIRLTRLVLFTVASHPSGSVVVAAVEGVPEVVVMSGDSLDIVAKIPVPVAGDDVEVTCVRFDASGERLWVGGTVGTDSAPFFRVARIGAANDAGGEDVVVADPVDDVVASNASEAMRPYAPEVGAKGVSKATALRKKQYDNAAEMEEKKKLRRDVTKGKRLVD
tara:strand:- start:1051 stop:1743 length:693 start_codon:yes stop_codon:yes gene_type:complete